MKRLADLDAPVAATLLDRLQVAGIPATATDLGHGTAGMLGLQRGGLQLRVWIEDESRRADAEAILHELLAEPHEVSRCPGCGYDLDGHAGATTCPECGLAVLASAEDVVAICDRCEEENPRDFEVCWKCGATLPGSGDDESPSDRGTNPPVNACRGCGRSVPAGSPSCPTCGSGVEPVGGRRPRIAPGGVIALAFIILFVVVTLLRGGW